MPFCSLCREEKDDTTTDHIIPRQWFATPPPPNLPVWKACNDCNGGLSNAEERLRNVFSKSENHEVEVIEPLAERAKRSGQRFEVTTRTVQNPNGIWIPNASVIGYEQADVDLVFGKITHGLYYHANGAYLPKDIAMKARVLNSNDGHSYSEIANKLEIHDMGLTFKWVTSSDPKGEKQIWIYCVFGGAAIVAVSVGDAVELPPPASGGLLRG